MRFSLLILKRPHVIRGIHRPAGTTLHVDEELAARGTADCITRQEAIRLWLDGAAVRAEDEPRRPLGYMTRMAHG